MRKPPVARRPELIGQEIDGFLFVEEVASGASSTVYRALQRPVDDRLVAVKVLDAVEQRLLLQGQDDLNPLWREARFSQTVRHPAIVRIFTTGRLPDGRYYVAMEFVDGHTLEEELRLRGPVGETEMLDLTGQIAAAVACLHDKRIVHRDLKPSNLLLDAALNVRLADMGIAKVAREPLPLHLSLHHFIHSACFTITSQVSQVAMTRVVWRLAGGAGAGARRQPRRDRQRARHARVHGPPVREHGPGDLCPPS